MRCAGIRGLVAMSIAASISTSRLAAAQPQLQPRSEPVSRDQCVAAFEEGQGFERRGKLMNAGRAFRTCAAPSCPNLVRNDCNERADRIDKALPSITFVVRDGAGNDVRATFKVDGAAWESSGRASPIDPGPHDVEYTVPGRPPITSQVTVQEGEKNRVVVLASASGGQPGTPAGILVVAEPKPSVPVASIVTGGLGVAALLVGVGLFVVASGEESDAEEQQRRSATLPGIEREAALRSEKSHSDAADTSRTLAFVFGAGGLLLVGGAVAYYFLERSNAKSASVRSPARPFRATASGLSFSF